MTVRAILTAVLVCVAGPALAQWQPKLSDNGAFVFGSASIAGVNARFRCNAPLAQGRPVIEDDADEVLRSAPYTIRLEIDPPLVPSEPSYRADLILDTGGGAFQLPPSEQDELFHTRVITFSMTDPMVTALLSASKLVLYVGSDTAWEFPTGGLADALRAAMTQCATRWAALGEVPPQGLPVDVGLPAPVAATASESDYPQFALTGSVVTRYLTALEEKVNAACGGAGEISNDAWLNNDMDGDGTEDHVLDWNEVSCAIGIPPKCRQHACIVDVSLSTRPTAPPIEILGKGPRFVAGAQGTSDLAFDTLLTGCATPDQPEACGPAVLFWNGSAMQISQTNTGQEAAPGQVAVPGAVTAHAQAQCGAEPASIGPDAIQAGDIDGDGTPDFLMDWSDVRCGDARPFCGAANCSIDVFLSRRGFADPVSLLGIGAQLVPRPDGGAGLAIEKPGTMSLCPPDGNCPTLVWDGADLSPLP